MDEVFPYKKDLDYSKLKLTKEGEYSITRRKDGQKILSIIKTISKDSKSITDVTGCVGGDTIMFGLNFQEVQSVELNKENFNVLAHNVNVFGLTNVQLHYGDAVHLYNWQTDILYIDPPWGGPTYKEAVELDLSISQLRLDLWLEEILLRRNRPSYIFLKLPSNYNFKRLNFLSNVEMIKPYRIRSYVLVAIYVHKPSSV
jgi:hypothetical protein